MVERDPASVTSEWVTVGRRRQWWARRAVHRWTSAMNGAVAASLVLVACQPQPAPQTQPTHGGVRTSQPGTSVVSVQPDQGWVPMSNRTSHVSNVTNASNASNVSPGAPVAPAPPAPTPEVAASKPVAQSIQDSVLADVDPHNDGVVAPPDELPGCFEELERLGASFTKADIPLSQPRGQVFTCGATQVVTYKGRPNSPKYNSAPRLTCRMALGLVRFEDIASRLAVEQFGVGLRRIEQGGTYSCRKMARFVNLVSEHSYANAIDIRSLQLANGRTVSVQRHFGDLSSRPTTPEAVFLRKLAERLYEDGVFSVVLTPFFDRLHHDHFHFDMARYRVKG